MNTLIVVNHLADWPLAPSFATVVCADDYLTDPRYRAPAHVVNLCRATDYQSTGYYVSLLAQARGQAPLPEVKTIEDLHSDALCQLLMTRLEPLVQTALAHVDAAAFDLTLYFGHDADNRLHDLAEHIFALLPAPLLHIRFERTLAERGRWHLAQVRSLALHEIADACQPLVRQAAMDHALRNSMPAGHRVKRKRERHKPAVAILYDPACQEPPSNASAIDKFQQAAQALDMAAEVITQTDRHRLADFDALFIRDTTSINHYTYHLSRQAAVDGLVVMDDPDSILQCTNKVYLTELFNCHRIPIPKTLVVHQENLDQVIPTLGLPCILKQPDGAFSLGVVKITSEQQLQTVAASFLQSSALILAQQYLPTAFDWRIGVLDRQPLFACKYFMAPGHWQIIKRQQDVKTSEGQAAAVPLAQVPPDVLHTALAAASLIGDGLYGVDLKYVDGRSYIIEINDNPNVDMGNEDGVMHDALYRQVMQVFRRRIDAPSWDHPLRRRTP